MNSNNLDISSYNNLSNTNTSIISKHFNHIIKKSIQCCCCNKMGDELIARTLYPINAYNNNYNNINNCIQVNITMEIQIVIIVSIQLIIVFHCN